MAEILGKFNLTKKPIPKINKPVEIRTQAAARVEIGVPIIDNTKQNIDRAKLLSRLRNKGVGILRVSGNKPKPKPAMSTGVSGPSSPAIELASTLEPVSEPVLEPASEPASASELASAITDDSGGQKQMLSIINKGSRKKLRLKSSQRPRLSRKSFKGTITRTAKIHHQGENKMRRRTMRSRPKTTPQHVDSASKQLQTIPSRTADDIKIGDSFLSERLPPLQPINITQSPYYMNNREHFIGFINRLLEPYKKTLKKEGETASKSSCEQKSGPFKPFAHQQIVRDYLGLHTPYRGLLLYHGLGSGKTCASIGIAEGLKSSKQIIVMTPASLRQNYIADLKKCADPLYRLNQYWEFIPVTKNDTELINVLSYELQLPVRYIRHKRGVWIVNTKKNPNYDTLSNNEKASLNQQIDNMITTKYRFINYNGLRLSHLDDLRSLSSTDNPFDNAVIIIDEAHNFVSRIVNKINNHNSLSYKLYEFLMNAVNCKVVFLTGTPIINYPNEIGIMFNILRGYIKTFTFNVNVKTSESVTQSTIKKAFGEFLLHDYIEYDVASKQIIITRNPYGFVRKNKTVGDKRVYRGVKRNKGDGSKCRTSRDGHGRGNCKPGFECINISADPANPDYRCIPVSDQGFIKMCKGVLRKINVEIIGNITITPHKALPDKLESFNSMFINAKNGTIKNENLFQRRILGLVSYFRSAREELMPAFDKETDFRIVDVEMSNYQFKLYEEARASERILEKRNAKQRKRQLKGGVYKDSTSTYRIFSRAFCNFVFPESIPRPMKNKSSDVASTIELQNIDEDDLDAISTKERIANIDGRFEADDFDKVDGSQAEENKEYMERIQEALNKLKANSSEYLSPIGLRKYSPKFLAMISRIIPHKEVEDTSPISRPGTEGKAGSAGAGTAEETKLSPVYDTDTTGIDLIYSQFRTVEGIGVFTLVLEQNGFTAFKLKKVNGVWEVDIPEDKKHLPKYALYTGTEESDEKEILRNVCNGDWEKIPNNIRDYITKQSPNNNHGEIIKVFMITSSGAEGINLKNIRRVHIMEPYWHPVRIEQVIGRARRICSHSKLPENERNVKVFLYLMKFTEQQLVPATENGMASNDLLLKDQSKLTHQPYTSDQSLFEISSIKENINKQILMSIKGAAIDCALHNNPNSPIKCLSFGKTKRTTFTTTPQLPSNASFAKEQKLNTKKITWRAQIIKIGDTSYAFKETRGKDYLGELYDIDSYNQVAETGGNPLYIGNLHKIGDTYEIRKPF